MSLTRPPSFAARRAQQRAAWLDALDRAQALAAAVAGGSALDSIDRRALSGASLQAGPFPLPYASAVAAASAFRDLVRGFCGAEVPELQAALGEAMAAAARCCRRMLDLDNDLQAASWRRRHAED